MDIVAVNLKARFTLTDEDGICTITNMLDADGDETDQINDAVSAVACLNQNTWFAIDLSAFKAAGAQ